MLATPFTELVGCSLPIQQAPMAVISSRCLPIAVAKAGGLGTISALGLSAGANGTIGAVTVNFLTDNLHRELVREVGARVCP